MSTTNNAGHTPCPLCNGLGHLQLLDAGQAIAQLVADFVQANDLELRPKPHTLGHDSAITNGE